MMILHFLCRLEQTIFYMKQEIEQKELGMGNFQGYPSLLRQIKHRVSFAQQKAMYAANEELLRMNWDIGEMLTKSQETDGWGKKTLQRLAVDLKNEYPERKGFSVRNMQCMMQFYNEYNKELTMVKVGNIPIAQSMIAQLGNAPIELPIKHLSWTHNIILIQQVKNIQARYWYMIQCIIGHWQTRYLTEAIKLDYYGKHGALANNFDTTLPATEALEVKSLLKDPIFSTCSLSPTNMTKETSRLGSSNISKNSWPKWELASLLWEDNITLRSQVMTIISIC